MTGLRPQEESAVSRRGSRRARFCRFGWSSDKPSNPERGVKTGGQLHKRREIESRHINRGHSHLQSAAVGVLYELHHGVKCALDLGSAKSIVRRGIRGIETDRHRSQPCLRQLLGDSVARVQKLTVTVGVETSPQPTGRCHVKTSSNAPNLRVGSPRPVNTTSRGLLVSSSTSMAAIT